MFFTRMSWLDTYLEFQDLESHLKPFLFVVQAFWAVVDHTDQKERR